MNVSNDSVMQILDVCKKDFKISQIQKEIYAVAHFLRARNGTGNFLEIGSKYGGTFHLWASLSENKNHKILLDLPAGKFAGISQESCDERDSKLRTLHQNFHTVIGDSHSLESFKNVINIMKVNKFDKLDFLFIDGDHTENGCMQDFQMYSPLVRKGGIVAFHDIKETKLHNKLGIKVHKVWENLKTQHKHWEFKQGNSMMGIGLLEI